MNIDLIKQKISQSTHNRHKYAVDLDMEYCMSSFYNYHDRPFVKSNSDKLNEANFGDLVVREMVPAFQRDNDKWALDRQISFVENVILGLKPTIQLYALESVNSYQQCLILDGLQRTTAIKSFISGYFTVFDGLTFQDCINNHINPLIRLEIFKFKTHQEACQFYIDINKGITHSDADIQRAVDFIMKGKS